MKVWVDGTLKITSTTDSDLAWGGVALSGWDALFDNLKVAYDTKADDAITSADDIVIDEDFAGATVSPTHDDAGNLWAERLFQARTRRGATGYPCRLRLRARRVEQPRPIRKPIHQQSVVKVLGDRLPACQPVQKPRE